MRRGAIGLALLAILAAACQTPVTTAPATVPATATPTLTAPPPASPNTTPAPSLQVAPREAQCNAQISGDLVLANDMTCPGDAFVIHVDNIVLDLGGHTITGPGMGPQAWRTPQLDSVGVRAGGHTGVTVRNGKISDFSTGIYFVDMVRSRIENVYSQRNRYGFYIHASTGITVTGSTVFANIYGLHLQDSSSNLVQGNRLAHQTYNSPGGAGNYPYRTG